MESRSLLVTRHEPSTFPKIGIKNAQFLELLEVEKNFEDEKVSFFSSCLACPLACLEMLCEWGREAFWDPGSNAVRSRSVCGEKYFSF